MSIMSIQSDVTQRIAGNEENAGNENAGKRSERAWCLSDGWRGRRKSISVFPCFPRFCRSSDLPLGISIKGLTLSDIALLNKSPQSYGVALAMWDHTVCYLRPDTNEHVPPNPRQTDWYSINLTRRDGRLSWVGLGGWVHTEMVYLKADNHPSK